MRKVKTFLENNQENLEKITLQSVNNMSVEAKMNSLNLSSFGGLSLVNAHGAQEGIFFNGYYDSYCFMPLLIFEGYSGKMILPLLKPWRRNKTANVADTLEWLVMALRAAWPETRRTEHQIHRDKCQKREHNWCL